MTQQIAKMINLSPPRIDTPKKAAQITGLPEFHIRRLLKEDKIVYIKAGRRYYVNIDKLIDYMNTGDSSLQPAQLTNGIRRID